MLHDIYFYLVVVLLILWVIQRLYVSKKILILLCACVALSSVLALRNAEFGVIDSYRYALYYDGFKYVNDFRDAIMHSNGKDMGYWGLTYIFQSLGFSYQQFVSIISVIIIGVWCWYVNKYSQDPLLSCFILIGSGCYTFMFYGLRQVIAFIFIILYIDACYNKKNKLSIIYMILAVLCHWSSVGMIPLFVVSKIRFSEIVIVGYIFVIVIMALFSTQIGYLITFLFRDEYLDSYSSSGGIGGLAIFYLLFLLLYIVVLRKRINEDYFCTFFLHAFIILCMIQICSAYAYSFTRLNYYYTLSILTVTVPKSFDNLKFLVGKKDSGYVSIILSVLIIVMMIRLFVSFIYGNRLEDYEFFWEGR